MDEILFSRQQFNALINRLEDIRNNVSGLKLKAQDTPEYIEAHDIIRLYHISKRTLERWRQTGRIPFNKVGNFFYYNTKDILGQIRLKENQFAVATPILPCLDEKGYFEQTSESVAHAKVFQGANHVATLFSGGTWRYLAEFGTPRIIDLTYAIIVI